MDFLSNSATSEAWIAAPRAKSSDGLSVVVSVTGEFTGTLSWEEGGNARSDFEGVGGHA